MDIAEANKRRKAEFREIARGIMQDINDKRRYRVAVDAAGTVARALEAAYMRGRKEEREGPPPAPEQDPHGAIDWLLIPPRPRQAFWSFCLKYVHCSEGGLQLMHDPRVRREVWVGLCDLAGPDTYDASATWGQASITPLLNLGLLEMGERTRTLRLSDVGRRTWSVALASVAGEPMMLCGPQAPKQRR